MSSFAEKASQDQGNPEGTPSTNNESQDQQFELQVGDRKYASLEEVATKLQNADSHISTIEGENASLREELEKLNAQLADAKKVDEVLDRMENKDKADVKVLTPEEVRELAKEEYSSVTQAQKQEANHSQCQQAMEATYGKNYIAELAAKAQELDITMEEVDQMAYTNPKLFLKTFGAEKQTPPPSLHSSTNSYNFNKTPDVDDIKAPMELSGKDRVNNFLKALEKYN